MPSLIIREYKSGSDNPDTTVKIPGTVLKIATKLIPRKALAAMQGQGIDRLMNQLVQAHLFGKMEYGRRES